MMIDSKFKPETVERFCTTLGQDLRLARKAVLAEDPDRYTMVVLNRLQTRVAEAQKLLQDMSKQIQLMDK
jgi:hypothetical protein